MAKIITFSRRFQSKHPRKGQNTYFVEKILNSLKIEYRDNPDYLRMLEDLNQTTLSAGTVTMRDIIDFFYSLKPGVTESKVHTIRRGKTAIAGEFRSFRFWSQIVNKISGRKGPYHSPQIIFAPETEIKKVWDFGMDLNGIFCINGYYTKRNMDKKLAKNDGLTEEDMFDWLMPNYENPKEFSGQILCWDQSINYNI